VTGPGPATVAAAGLARALFAPRAVALIGASGDPARPAARPSRFLRRHGFAGRIIPINPRRQEVDGLPCYPTLAEAPGPVDHAFIMCRSDEVADAVRQCGAAGVRVATVLSDGFAEAGAAGQSRQAEVLAVAGRAGVRLLGPNSIGVVDTDGFVCTANAAFDLTELPRGGLSVISQSGSMIGALLSQGAARGIGFSRLVSTGNEADLGVGELGTLMLDDPRCTAILLFLESIRDRAGLAEFARHADACGKPVIAYKLGRSAAGQALAQTHTGALAGDDAMVDALLADLGIARVGMLESLLESPPLFRNAAPAAGRRVAVVTTTGGGGAMVVDCLGALDVAVVPPPPAVSDILAGAGIGGGSGTLVDLTLAGTRPELVRGVLEQLMASDGIDAVAMVIGSSAQFQPDLAVAPLTGFAGAPKPLAVYIVPAADRSQRMLVDAGLAVFRTPESCAEALRARLARRAPLQRPLPDAALCERAARLIAAAEGPSLTEPQARAVFAALGVDAPPSVLARSPDEAAAAARQAGAPVAAKIVSADILHRSDFGGVMLKVTAGDAAAAFETLSARAGAAYPGARIDGVLIHPMQSGVAEVLLGYRNDPVAGPMVMLGMGGVLAELTRETVLRVAPVDRAMAQAMIAALPGLDLARGFRNRPRGDLAALAEAIVAVSRLAWLPQVTEAEINPLLVRREGEGVVALDAVLLRDLGLDGAGE